VLPKDVLISERTQAYCLEPVSHLKGTQLYFGRPACPVSVSPTTRTRGYESRNRLVRAAKVRYDARMEQDPEIRKVLSEIGWRGGIARKNALCRKERVAIARKASKAAAAGRMKKAQERQRGSK
jgi:hypothetical protein